MKRDKSLVKEVEEIEAMAGPDGVKATAEILKAEEKEELELKQRIVDEIEGERRNKLQYNRFLTDLLDKELKKSDLRGMSYQLAPTEIGVVMELKSLGDGTLYRAAFKSTGDGILDLNAVMTYAVRAEMTAERIMNARLILT